MIGHLKEVILCEFVWTRFIPKHYGSVWEVKGLNRPQVTSVDLNHVCASNNVVSKGYVSQEKIAFSLLMFTGRIAETHTTTKSLICY